MIELNIYINFIHEFETSLKNKYNIKGSILSASRESLARKGTLLSYTYHFHGIGCRIEKDGVICEYDMTSEHEFSIIFSKWKLFTFIQTHPSIEKIDRESFEKKIKALLKRDIISYFYIGNIKTGVYQISTKYLANW